LQFGFQFYRTLYGERNFYHFFTVSIQKEEPPSRVDGGFYLSSCE
jgi:hypothetical protein